MPTTLTLRVLTVTLLLSFAFLVTVPLVFADHGDTEESVSHATTAHDHDEDETEDSDPKLVAMKAQLEVLRQVVAQLVAAAQGNSTVEAEHSHDELYEMDENIPTLEVEIIPGKVGYAVHAETTNFTFSPEHADGTHVDNEGHAHIYLDDVKISRMYGPWFYLGEIKEKGAHTVRVELSTNDHHAYGHDGEKIDDSVVIEVK